MKWPLLAAATTLAEVLHYTRCQAHSLDTVPYASLPLHDRRELELTAIRTLRKLTPKPKKVIGRISPTEPYGVSQGDTV